MSAARNVPVCLPCVTATPSSAVISCDAISNMHGTELILCAPTLLEYVPGGHLTQSFGFFNPIAAEYLPASQPKHAEMSLLPFSVL